MKAIKAAHRLRLSGKGAVGSLGTMARQFASNSKKNGAQHAVPLLTQGDAVQSKEEVATRIRYLSSALPLPSDEIDDERQQKYHQNQLRQQEHVRQPRQQWTPPPMFPRRRPNQIPASMEFQEIALEADHIKSTFSGPQTIKYTGDAVIPVTSTLRLVTPDQDAPRGIWPVFRMMDENGQFRQKVDRDVMNATGSMMETAEERDLTKLRETLCEMYPHYKKEFEQSGLLQPSKYNFADVESSNTLIRAHRHMIRLREMDNILLNAQRQGRISFYMTCSGEEAIHMGAASALDSQDPIFAQYREQGLLMWRGFTLEQFSNQCFSNDLDLGKGRQMPIHYGSKALNYHTVSSPLGTQLPQAVGAAYRLKLAGKPNVVICFFGEGCASTIDFHSALNFAATLRTPVVFFCRNNGYAISTSVADQYAGDGVVARAPGYGMAGIRVDGNDIFAVHAAVREARKYALEHNAPVLIEGMTYRQGHHSTSDDSTRYREKEEVEEFTNEHDPMVRFDSFLQNHAQWVSPNEIAQIRDEEKNKVLAAMKKAESRPKPPLDDLFEDVYYEMPPHIQEQRQQLLEHISKYPKQYNP